MKLSLLKSLQEEVQTTEDEKVLQKHVRKVLKGGHYDSVGLKKDGSFVVKRGYFYRVQAGGSPENLAKGVESHLKKANLKVYDMEAHDHWAAWPKDSYFWVKFRVKHEDLAKEEKKEVKEEQLHEVKSGDFKSALVGQRVKMISDEHKGKVGEITRASHEHTFSQMVPFVTRYSIKFDDGSHGSDIRKEQFRKEKSTKEEVKEATNKLIYSVDGSIEKQKLDKLINSVIERYKLDPKIFARIKKDVIDDYSESDISQVTAQDIIEIIDAGGIAESGPTLRYHKSFKLGSGLRLNIAKSGLSLSAGKSGFDFNLRKGGSMTTVGVPGTGLSF